MLGPWGVPVPESPGEDPPPHTESDNPPVTTMWGYRGLMMPVMPAPDDELVAPWCLCAAPGVPRGYELKVEKHVHHTCWNCGVECISRFVHAYNCNGCEVSESNACNGPPHPEFDIEQAATRPNP